MAEVHSGMIIAGKYRLEGALARGGMGSVWQARHIALDTRLAIKFIGPDVCRLQEARRRFEREAKASAMLHSPHVVQIHDYGLEGDMPYLVMELLTGEDLGERLRRRGKLSVGETSRIVTQVARALRRAAEAGIVHRDLKPSNVFLVAGDDDEELVKVLDFGIAKAPRLDVTEQTATGAIIGSPRYMSPEQARASPLVDPRSDLWSLAVIAYRALTGVHPFDSTEMTDLIVRICCDTPAPPSQIDPSLDPDLDGFFVRALARDPSERFQTARELASAFALAVGEAPSSMTSATLLRMASPDSPRPRATSDAGSGAPPPPGDDAAGRAAAPPPPPRAPLVIRRPTPPSFAATKLSAQSPPVTKPAPPPVAVEAPPRVATEASPPEAAPRASPAPPAPAGRAASSSDTPAEPAASRRFVAGLQARPSSPSSRPSPSVPRPVLDLARSPEPELSLTTYPDMLPARTSLPPRRAIVRRAAAGAALLALAAAAVWLLAPWEGGPTGARGSAAPPEVSAPPAATVAAPSAPPPPPASQEPASASAPEAPEPPPAARSAPHPSKRAPPPAGRAKRHPILGI